MSLIGSWLVVSMLALAAMHLSLRRHYGKSPRVWAWVEQLWLALSFVGVTFAVVQVVDRLHTFQSDAAKAQITSDWTYGTDHFGTLASEIKDPAIIKLYEGKEKIRATAESRFARIDSFARRDQVSLAANANLFGMITDFCLNGVGFYKFTPDKPTEFLHQFFENDKQPIEIEFSELSVLACAAAYDISARASEAIALDAEHESLKPFTLVSVFWYVPLAFGFALKCTKNISDLVKAG